MTVRFLVVASALALSAFASAEERRPNVVLILADDLGRSDTGIYAPHALHETPALDALAARGMRFTNAYCAAPVCAPSRHALQTGLRTARSGMYGGPETGEGNVVVLEPSPGTSAPKGQRLMEPVDVTRIRPDYRTLAEALQDEGYVTGHFGKWHLGGGRHTPSNNGYDFEMPRMYGAMPTGRKVFDAEGRHIDDVCADAAIEFMQTNREKPFFVAYNAFLVHSPWEAKPALVERYRERATEVGSDASPTYAAMVKALDLNVDRLTKAIDALGLTEKTIVIFASDNGGVVHAKVDGVPVTSNAPFRSGKGTLYEGGIRIPMVIAGPGVVRADSTSDALAETVDLYPTILDLVGAKPAPDHALDGISLRPALAGEPMKRDALYWYFPSDSRGVADRTLPSAAIRQGDLKLIREFYAAADGAHALKLYDLANDPGETIDLASARPDVVRAMDAKLDAWLTVCGTVLPQPNPDYVP